MTDDLLDAECAIEHLCTLRIIENTDWKGNHYLDNDSADYSIFFDNPNHEGDIRLQIIKRARQYFIPCSIIKILVKRHHFNVNNILEECATNAA
jgi:hypothetical protein